MIRVTRRIIEAIHIGLHPNNIKRDSGIEIPEGWMPTIKHHNNKRTVRQRTAEGTNHWGKQQGSKWTNQSCWKTTYHSRASCLIRSRMTSRPHRLKKTSSMQPKRRDLHHTWLHRETNEKKLSFYCKELFPLALITHQSLSCLYLNWISLFLNCFYYILAFLVNLISEIIWFHQLSW